MRPLPAWHWEIPAQFNIAAACTDAHLDTPRAPRAAVVCDDAARGVRQLTFAELAHATSRFAELLRRLPIDAGGRVLIRLPNCLEYPVAFLGAMKRGAVSVPSSILLTADELLFLARDSGAEALVTSTDTWNAMHGALEEVETLRHVLLTGRGDAVRATRLSVAPLDAALAAIETWAPPHPTAADDPAYLVYTSGTTGYAKGALHAHRALLGHLPASEFWFSFAPDGSDRVLHSGKYNWTYVLGTGLMDPLYRGVTTIVYEGPADPHTWPQLIARHGATIFIGVPTLYRQILQRTDATAADVPTLRHCMCAGEALSGEVLLDWQARFGQPIYEGLGMTECSYYLSQPRGWEIRPGSVGFPQPGHDVRLLDPTTLTPVPTGAEGMLCIPRSDPGLLLRYWNRDAETAESFRDGWFMTGDYARLDADGYLWFLGRKDDLINTFGYRVSPFEVERVIKDHPAVADCAAIGEEVAAGKIVVAVYITARPHVALSLADILAWARQHLAAYKAPRIAYLVDELP
ncbi:MAG: AMP-binding protein, partial [Deltaproteobacteria bacterium]|nr:AMP-binding protein [Deltaproteobacteria bacterium]